MDERDYIALCYLFFFLLFIFFLGIVMVIEMLHFLWLDLAFKLNSSRLLNDSINY